MKMGKFIAILLVVCCNCAHSMSNLDYSKVDEGIHDTVKKLFKYSFGKNIQVQDIVKKSIQQIEKNSQGKQLLKRIENLFSVFSGLSEITDFRFDKNIEIQIDDSGTSFIGTSFSETEELKTRININLQESNIVWHDELGLCSVIPALSKVKEIDGVNYCEIQLCADPYWLTIAHELIHMEHFLAEELNNYINK